MLEEKRRMVIGKASIDQDRCLPGKRGTCIVCGDVPHATKSIRLEEAEVITSTGQTITVKRPSVLRDLCIGCGICEHYCPLEGSAAIRIYDA
jgi:translation initiation factor RLI1